MKRFRLGTLMLLIVIAALGTALVVQQQRAARREAEVQARLAEAQAERAVLQSVLARQERLYRRLQQKGDSGAGDTRKPVVVETPGPKEGDEK